MKLTVKQLSLDQIDQNEQIREWIAQFPDNDQLTAKSLLSRIRFISRDEFSKWLLAEFEQYKGYQPCAIYAVRKFSEEIESFWCDDGSVQLRPAETQGSEDLVSSIIANANKRNDNAFLDHSSLTELREKKVRHIILVDDSIGSGKRVSDFIRRMMSNRTFRSWWSYGFITIHILSYARTDQADKYILTHVAGSDHGKRKRRLSDKLLFKSFNVYNALDLHTRWGNSHISILGLCDSIMKIKKDRRRGFGEVMGNLVFYHSVPNNIPGILYSSRKNWSPLFPDRIIPRWMVNLLDSKVSGDSEVLSGENKKMPIPKDAGEVLYLIKSGLRKKSSLANRLNCDLGLVSQIIVNCISLGLLTEKLRLTKAGVNFVLDKRNEKTMLIPNYDLYVPNSWCVGRETVQPSVVGLRAEWQIDSAGVSSVDGDDGESSLERTDAKATSSPIKGVTQHPSGSRDRHTLHGPTGLKE